MSGPSVLPMVGRDQELALLLERWARAKAGEGQGVLLVGEAGIGKSRISRALLDAHADEPHTRIRYQCSPYHVDSAFWPVIQQLTHAAGITASNPLESNLDRLEALLGRARQCAADVAPLIADLIGLDGHARYGTLDLTPQMKRARTLEALVDQLLSLAAQQPVLVVLEDAHWIDPTTLEMIEQGLDRIATARVLILLTSRPDQQPALAAHPHVTRLTLNRLGRGAVEAIVARLIGDKKLTTDVIDTIIARTDGIPLFVEELTKAVVESGEMSIPASLHDSLMARLDRLAPVKEVAQIGAVIGREFSHGLLAAVADRPEDQLESALDELVASELVFRRGTSPQATYSFKHALVQDVAYESLLKSRRQKLHLQIAEALDKKLAQTVEIEPELLAHHYTLAGITDQAIEYWQKAGERAIRRSANVEAINHLMKGLELLETLPDTRDRSHRELALQLTLGPALMAAKGQGASEARQAYTRACELGQQVGDTRQHFRALWGSWRSHVVQSEHSAARALAEQCLNLAEKSQDVALVLEACFALGGTLVFIGDFAAARVHLERAIPLYDIKKHRSLAFLYGQDPGASSLSYMSWTLWLCGFPERALERGRQALALAEALDHPLTLALVLMWLAMSHILCRDWRAAQSQAEASMKLSNEQGFPQTFWFGSVMQGRALVEEGRLENGIPQIEEGIAARKAIGMRLAQLFELALLAEAYGVAKRTEEGLRVLDEALDFANRTGEGFYAPELHRLKGELLLSQGKPGAAMQAETCFRRGLDGAHRQQAKSLELRGATSLARLWAKQGKWSQARDLLAPVYGWFTEGFDTADLKDAKALLDELR
jgi:predicted ATPase